MATKRDAKRAGPTDQCFAPRGVVLAEHAWKPPIVKLNAARRCRHAASLAGAAGNAMRSQSAVRELYFPNASRPGDRRPARASATGNGGRN